MAAPVNATINIFANTTQAVAQFKSLQAQVATLNKTVSATSGAAAAQQAALNKALMNSANSSRMWNARIVPMNTAVGQFSDALDKGRMSLGQYTRHAASQLPGMSRVFKREFDMMNRAATQNVRQMQTQYVQLGRSATGAAQAMALTPTALNKQAAATAIAAQRQMMMNRMIDLGTTKLLNWGKNTQWAGRQLMVGFSIPLAMMGAAAAKAFKEIDKSSISFKRVYGDLQTTTAEMERNLSAVKDLGDEYIRYGVKLSDTIGLAADVAATGAKNETLMAATEQTLRLATLGLMEHGEALDATIALQTAFQVSNEELAGTIDFLNVVENETILTMQDMAAAIPRVAPVVKGLGGDVKDLAVFMTAMREGGVTAEQGANALKSGLGRLINPTKAAREEMAKYGISIDAITQKNKGDLMATLQDFGNALTQLGDFEQQQVLQKVFGTYQYARLGALFKNLSRDSGQAARTIELTSMSVEDLARISERELGKIEEATSTKFTASVEKLKVAIAPIGETFMKALMPIINFATKLLERFDSLPDNIKNGIAIAIAAIAGLGPVILMTVGLVANGIANIGKFIQLIRKFFARLKGDASLFDHLTRQEREAASAATNLGGATEGLTGKFLGQQKALERLIQLVGAYSGALRSSAAAMPAGMGFMPVPGRGGSVGKPSASPTSGPKSFFSPAGRMLPPKQFADGVTQVPGTGNKDTIPALLTPGESVVTKKASQKYAPIIAAMNAGTLPGFVKGVITIGEGTQTRNVEVGGRGQSGVDSIQLMINSAVNALVEGGMDLAQAIERVAATVEAKQAEAGFTQRDNSPKVMDSSALAGALQELGVTPDQLGLLPPASDTRPKQVNVPGAFELAHFGGRGQMSGAELKEYAAQRGGGFQSGVEAMLEKRAEKITAELMAEGFDPGEISGMVSQRIDDALYSTLDNRVVGLSRELNQELGETGSGKSAPAELVKRDLVERGDVAHGMLAAEMERAGVPREQQISAIEDINAGIRAKLDDIPNDVLMTAEEIDAITTETYESIAEGNENVRGAYERMSEVSTVVDPDARGGRQERVGDSRAYKNQREKIFDAMENVKTGEFQYPAAADFQIPEGVMQNLGTTRQEIASAYNSLTDDAKIRISQHAKNVEGMTDQFTQELREAGIRLGQAPVDGIEQGASQSSSQRAAQQGEVITEGVEQGIRSGTPEVVQAAEELRTQVDQAIAQPNNPAAGLLGQMGSGAPQPMKISYSPNAKKQMEAIGAQSLAGKSFKELSGMMKKEFGTIGKELNSIFRQIPNFAHESIRNIKPVFSSLGKVFLDLNPWITKSVDSIRRFLTQVSYSWMGLKLTGVEVLKNALARAKAVYTEVFLQTQIAWESVKALPARAKSAYQTAMLKTMMAWDSVKRMPAQMTNLVSTFMSDLPRNLQRLRNQVFYRGQDVAKRVSERFAGIRERFGSSAGASVAALRERDPRTAARAFVPDRAAAQVKAMSEQIVNATNTIKNKLTETATNVANSARLAKILLKEGDTRGALRAITPDKVAQAFSAATKSIVDAGRFVQKNLLDAGRFVGKNLVDASKFIGGRVSDAAKKLTAAGQNLANSLKVAGSALAMRDPKTALRALTPDKLASALSAAPSMIKNGVNKLYESLLWGSIRAVTGIENATAAIKTGIINSFNFATQAVRTGATKLYESLLWGSVRAVEGLEKTLNTIKTKTVAKWQQVLMSLNSANLKGAMTDAWKGVKGAATQGAKNIRESLVSVGTSIKTAGSIAAKMISLTGSGALGLAGAAGSAGKGISGFLGSVSEKTGRTRAQSIGNATNSAMMGMMGLSMAASMAGGEIGEMSQKIMPVTMGLMGLQMVLPMLKSPLGLAIIAIAALSAVFVKTRMDLDNFAKEAANAGANLGGFANRLKSITDATGYEFASSRAQERLFRFTDVEKEGVSGFAEYFESEGGKKFLTELTKLSEPERYQEVAKMISFAIADGMDEETAKKYGYSIAYYLGDATMKQRLQGDFAANRFAGGIDKVIEIIEERQTRLDQLVGSFSAVEVGQSGLSRSLAERTGIGQYDTQKSMFAEGVAKTGAAAGTGALLGLGGAGLASVASLGTIVGQATGTALGGAMVATTGTRIGAMLGSVTGPVGMVIGALAGTLVGGLIAWKQYQEQVARLNENVGNGAMILGNSIQVLGEVRNAEDLLIEQRRKGIVTTEEFTAQMERLNEIENRASQAVSGVVQSMMMGGQVDQGALMQAMENQFVVAGFEGDLAKAVTGIVNPQTVGKALFPENTMDEILSDVSKRNVVSAVITETLAGITPENAQQKIADVQNLWAGMADDLIDAAEEGLTLDEMRAVAAGKKAGEMIYDALMTGAEAGMEGGVGDQLANTSAEAYKAAAQAFSGEGPNAQNVKDLEDGTKQVEIDGTVYTARVGEDQKTLAQMGVDKFDIGKVFGDTEFTAEDIEATKRATEASGLSTEDLFAQQIFETPNTKKNIESILAEGSGFDFTTLEGFGLGETEEQIRASLQSALDKAQLQFDLGDVQIIGAEESARVVADTWADIVEAQEEGLRGEATQIGLTAATSALGDETMSQIAAGETVSLPRGRGKVNVSDAPLKATSDDLIKLVNDLQDEAFAGINLEKAIADIFATDGAKSVDEAFNIYKDKFGGLSEVFGSETQSIIDYLGEVGNASKEGADDIAEVGTVVKTLPDDLKSKLGISQEDIGSWANFDAVALQTLRDYSSIYSELPEGVDLSSSLEFLTLDENGEPLSPPEAAKRVKQTKKLLKDIEGAETIEAKKTAMFEFQVENLGMDPTEFESTWSDLVGRFGEAKIMNLGTDQLLKTFAISLQLEGSVKELADAEAALATMNPVDEGYAELQQRIEGLKIAVAQQESALVSSVEFPGKGARDTSGNRGGGGGGGKDSFIKTFKSDLLEQIKLWSDSTATIKDLNTLKSSFVDQILKGQGLFDKLTGLKGLTPTQLQEIVGSGPEGVKEFLKKYVKDGKLTKQGIQLMRAQSLAGVDQTISQSAIETLTEQDQVKAANIMRGPRVTKILGQAASPELMESIAGDPDKAQKLVALQKEVRKGSEGSVKKLKEFIQTEQGLIDAIKERTEVMKTEAEKQKEAFDAVTQSIENQITTMEIDLTKAFEQTQGMLPAEMELEIRKREQIIKQIEVQIEALNKLNSLDESRIESLNRQKEMLTRQIQVLERANEMDQRQTESLKRQDEIRNRESEALNKDLEQLSTAEDKIRESYEKRIDALDKVSKINDHIVNQQKQQLDLSRAIAEGDIYSATAAAQQMRATSASFAAEQTRAGLEQGMESQIAGLRTAGGLTREQAEEQIANIKEQSYQTSLLIRDIEDKIYQRNLELVPLKDQQYQLDLQIRDVQDIIYGRNEQIKIIQQQQIQPLVDQNTQQQGILDKLNAEVDEKTGPLKARLDWYIKQETQNERVRLQTESIAGWTEKAKDRAKTLADNWGTVATNAWNAAQNIAAASAAQTPNPANKYAGGVIDGYGMGGKIKQYRSGGVAGDGSRDSVMAMLTPGEFVVRKAMVEKYGMPLMKALNQGSFDMPTYQTGPEMPEVGAINNTTVSNVNAPVYNTYDMKFAINGTNQSADEIANKVMFKMKQVQGQGIRSNRGY